MSKKAQTVEIKTPQALHIADVVGQSEQCCSPPEPFYLGTTCPKCKKPFRNVKTE